MEKMTTQKEIQARVFWAVADAGALTTRRIVEEFGPKPNWQKLITDQHLREYLTVYGPVLALGQTARRYFARHPGAVEQGPVPYIAGPSAVADRAYQQDVLKALTGQGYTVHHHEYKRTGQVGSAARTGRKTTDQILRTVVEVPPQQMRVLAIDWRGLKPYHRDGWGMYPKVVGYPYLYASIAHGGIKLPKLKALYRQHKADIDSWRSPLLVAVPDEQELRAFIRAEESKRQRLHKKVMTAAGKPNLQLYDAIQLVILPPP